ncbi:MAG: hypothetical protein JXD23_00955 [Spirochaetales bacterium]|nr:hypothetical protein [Spirochaetales bacterium]
MNALKPIAKIMLAGGLFALVSWPAARPLNAQGKPQKPALTLTDNLASSTKNLIIDTPDWRVGFSLYYNGGVYQIFDKVTDPDMKDNLVSGPTYSHGGIFDYDVYLTGGQEFMTTLGKNANRGRESLRVLENTPVRVRLLQSGRPRLNNGDGPTGDPFHESDMVETSTEWTFYPTGRVYIQFDADFAPGWTGLVSQGPGGEGKGISVDGFAIKAVNGADFFFPWVTAGDTIESASGGWGPYEINRRADKYTLRLLKKPPKGENLDFIIRRPWITNETFSIHADGGTGGPNRRRMWDGGSDGDPVFGTGKRTEETRKGQTPVGNDYVYAHWTLDPRGFGSALVFNEPYPEANFAVINDFDYGDISYTQVGCGGTRPFKPHHRHFLAQLGVENGAGTPRIKGIPDALPFAEDYRHPYATARVGVLKTGKGVSAYGFDVATGAYQITAKKKAAAIVFDASRGGTVKKPLPYKAPAVLVFGLDAPDNRIAVELSRNNGKSWKPVPASDYNLTTRAQAAQLGGKDRRLIQLLVNVPADAAGAKAWVLRLRAK